MLRSLFISFILLLSCQKKDPLDTIPLSEEKLVKVMADAYLAEAAIMNYTPDMKDSLSDYFYGQVYEINGVSEEDYQLSLAVIKQHPEIMDSLYTKISQRLVELEEMKLKTD
ncbi:MAG: DUF4296 domain-containing protein [Bacteroidota bacterium]